MGRFLALATVALALAACGDDTPAPMVPPPAPGPKPGMYELDAEATLERVRSRGSPATLEDVRAVAMGLELAPDGTFIGRSTAEGEPHRASGTWKAEEDRVTITTLVVDGSALPSPQVNTAAHRDGALYLEGGTSNPPLVLRRRGDG
jgi:hypothetical protein